MSAEKLAPAQAEGRSLIGPAASAPPNNGGRYPPEDCQIEVEQRKALCPAGKENTPCSRLEEQATGKVSYRFEWSTHCAECPLREHWGGRTPQRVTGTAAGTKDRSLCPTDETSQRDRKHAERVDAGARDAAGLSAVRHRRARYRGLAKARLQNYFAAAACNVKRWIRRKVWEFSQAQATRVPAMS